MACRCEIERMKTDFDLVRRLAVKFAVVIAEPVRLYRKTSADYGTQYDFEPASLNPKLEAVEIITSLTHSPNNSLTQ